MMFKLWLNFLFPSINSNIHLPGNATCIAKQFLRCCCHQLLSNGLFQRLFMSHFVDADFFRALGTSLGEFGGVNQVTPLITVFEDLNERKHLPPYLELYHMLDNVANYLDILPLESVPSSAASWPSFLTNFDLFLKSLALTVLADVQVDMTPVLRIMHSTLKLTMINGHKQVSFNTFPITFCSSDLLMFFL